MKRILVIGSLNMDLMLEVEKLPLPGETISSKSFQLLSGGKGMNQAVCAGKLGGNVALAGCVGEDEYGKKLLEQLEINRINKDSIAVLKEEATGLAVVTTSNEDNSIVIVPGANNKVDLDFIESIKDEILKADLVILQLEIPLESVYKAIDICYENQIMTILNPAPAKEIDLEYIKKVTYFTPNESELKEIFNIEYPMVLKAYPNKIIMTAGSKGAYYHDGESLVNIAANKVEVLDTTGAGDSFNSALAIGILEGKNLSDAIKYANCIAGITTTVRGAQGASSDKYILNT